jgi:hypothetical protein
MDFISNPVFICGHPKSGTSLITALLDGHPEVIAYPEETMFFRRFLPAINGKTLSEKIEIAEKQLIHIFEWNLSDPPEHQKGYPDRDYSDISFDAIREKMQCYLDQHKDKDSEFLNAVMVSFGEVSGLVNERTKHWIEKTPYNEYYSEKIFEWWPKARCIHILRDPRDNFVSYRKKHPNWSPQMFANNWVKSAKAGRTNIEKFGSTRYHLLKFEDLLTKPEEIMRELANFLELTWDECLLMPTRAGDAWRGNSMFAEKYQGISQKPLMRWREELSPYDQALLQAISGRLMKTLGYPLFKPDDGEFGCQQKLRILKEKAFSWLK